MVSLVNFTSRKPIEYSVARATITLYARVDFGLASVVEKEYAGKKVQQMCQKFAMIVGFI